MPYTEDDVPFVGISETSQIAAQTLRSREVDETRILAVLERKALHGATCDEVEVELSLAHQTASARIKGLRDKGRLLKTATVRQTRRHRPASVYVLSAYREWVEVVEG